MKGLITVKDINKPSSIRAPQGRDGAAWRGARRRRGDGPERAGRPVNAEVDVLVIDTAHGHTEGVIKPSR